MPSCHACGEAISAGEAFCQHCGAKLDPSEAPGAHAMPEPAPMSRPSRPSIARTDEQPTGYEAPTPRADSPRPTQDPAAVPVLPAGTSNSELLGQAAPNQQYLGQRLLFREGEAESLDPVSLRFVIAILVHLAVMLVWWIAGTFAIAVVFLALAHSAAITVLFATFWSLAITVAFFALPLSVSISEWKFMLDGKADAAAPAFEHIAWAFRRRATPVNELRVQRLALGPGASRDYLYIHDGVFRGYVSCFAYGRDLYVGWTLWWRLSVAAWARTNSVRQYQMLTLRGSELHNIHRYDSAKAMREALHGAAREGLDAATGLIEFAGEGTIGSAIPLETVKDPRNAPGP